MKPSLTDTLCTQCGLCCDGSLFADVELASGDEAAGLEILGLEIEDGDERDGALLVQPCRALEGKHCRIYPHRPECCRTFECRLLQQVKRGVVGVEDAKAKIAEALEQIARIQEFSVLFAKGNKRLPLKERCAEALVTAGQSAGSQELSRKRAELRAAMSSYERLIKEVFLGS
jgi:uncharacterized protein